MDKLEEHLYPIWKRLTHNPLREDAFYSFVRDIRRVTKDEDRDRIYVLNQRWELLESFISEFLEVKDITRSAYLNVHNRMHEIEQELS